MLTQALRDDAPLKIKIDAESSYAGQRSHRAKYGILKQLIITNNG